MRQFEGYFDQAESAFQELDQAFEAYDLLCPRDQELSGFGDEYALRRTSSIATWRHSKVATRSSPSTVGSFQKESAGLVSGAAETAFSQAGAGFLLFVSLLSSFLLGALKPRECNWSWGSERA